MKIYEKDNKDSASIYKKLVGSRVFFAVLIPIFIALIFGVFQNFYYRYRVQKDLNQLNAEVASLNKQKNDLGKLLEYYKSQSNLEKEARIRLNLKKEGEKVVIILPNATSSSEGGETIYGASQSSPDLPNYKQWWYYFFGK